MKTVLILSNNDMGLYKFRKELLVELNKVYNVYVSLPFGKYVEQLIECGGEYINACINRRGLNPLKDIKLILFYRKLVKRIRPDIILTYTIKPNIYGGIVSRFMNVPHIANITGLGTAIESKSFLSKILLRLYRFSIKKSKVVFFQNSDNMQFFKKKSNIYQKHILLPGSGININDFTLLEYPQTDQKINLLFIGRIMKAKGIDELLEVSKLINNNDVTFTLVGPFDEDYKDIIKEYSNKGFINYIGETNDVKRYLEKAHAILHPSYHEGMSNVLLEAAASGRPIIASDIPGCREIFDDGISGFGFKAKDVKSTLNAINTFLDLNYNTKKQMGLNAREKVIHNFNRNIIVNFYLNAINNLIGEKNESI